MASGLAVWLILAHESKCYFWEEAVKYCVCGLGLSSVQDGQCLGRWAVTLGPQSKADGAEELTQTMVDMRREHVINLSC